MLHAAPVVGHRHAVVECLTLRALATPLCGLAVLLAFGCCCSGGGGGRRRRRRLLLPAFRFAVLEEGGVEALVNVMCLRSKTPGGAGGSPPL